LVTTASPVCPGGLGTEEFFADDRDGRAEQTIEVRFLCLVVHNDEREGYWRVLRTEFVLVGKLARAIRSDLVDVDSGPTRMLMAKEAQVPADRVALFERLLSSRPAQPSQKGKDNGGDAHAFRTAFVA
jgi:hypothetical protein